MYSPIENKKEKVEFLVAFFITFLFIFIPLTITFAGNTKRFFSTPPGALNLDQCNGPWAVTFSDKTDDPNVKSDAAIEKNKRKLADAINAEIAKFPKSKFLKTNGGLDDPGKAFVDASIENNINPILLVAMAYTNSDMASTTNAALKCGNPWGQQPITGKPTCQTNDGGQTLSWYEYNKDHQYNEGMIGDEAKRVFQTYLNQTDWNPPLITLDDFVQRYDEKNPWREMGVPDQSKSIADNYKTVYNDILTSKNGKDTLVCSQSGNGGGDLANADSLSVKGIECVLDATGHGYNLKPYAQDLYKAAHDFHVNPLYSLAQFDKDSSLGTAGAGLDNKNPGNIGCDQGYTTGAGVQYSCADFAVFNTFGDGMRAHNWLIRTEYLDQGLTTIEAIINKYAPPSANDTNQYIQDVKDFMSKYGPMCSGQ